VTLTACEWAGFSVLKKMGWAERVAASVRYLADPADRQLTEMPTVSLPPARSCPSSDRGPAIVSQALPFRTCARTTTRTPIEQIWPLPDEHPSIRTVALNRTDAAAEHVGEQAGSRARVDARTTCA